MQECSPYRNCVTHLAREQHTAGGRGGVSPEVGGGRLLQSVSTWGLQQAIHPPGPGPIGSGRAAVRMWKSLSWSGGGGPWQEDWQEGTLRAGVSCSPDLTGFLRKAVRGKEAPGCGGDWARPQGVEGAEGPVQVGLCSGHVRPGPGPADSAGPNLTSTPAWDRLPPKKSRSRSPRQRPPLMGWWGEWVRAPAPGSTAGRGPVGAALTASDSSCPC